MQAKADNIQIQSTYQEAHRSKSAELNSRTGTMAPPRKHVSVAFSSAHAIITNVMQVAGVMVSTAIIARMLGPEGKGVYDLYATGAALLSAALTLGISSGLVYIISSKRVNLIALAGYTLVFTLLCGVVAFAIVSSLTTMHLSQPWLPMKLGKYTALLMALGVIALAASGNARAFLSGQRRFLYANYGDICKQIIGILLLFAAFQAARRFHWSILSGVVSSNIATVVLTTVIYLAFAGLIRREQTGPAYIGACFAFALPCYVGTMVQYLNYRMDVFFVSTWHGSAEVGVYQVGAVIAQAINMIPSTVQWILFPTISAAYAGGESRASQVAQMNRLLTWASVLLGGILFFIAPFLVPRIYGAPFIRSVIALQILIPGCVVFVTANILAGFFAGIGKPRINLVASLVGFAITLALDISLIPKWGFVGAAWASTISYASTALVTALLFKRETNISLKSLCVPVAADALAVKNIFHEMGSAVRSKTGN